MSTKTNPNVPQQSTLEDWHIDADALGRHYALSDIQPLSEGDGFRLSPIFGRAEGFREIIKLNDDFQVVIGDITVHEDASISMKSDATLKLHFRLEGTGGIGLKDNSDSEINQHTVGILLHPDVIDKRELYIAGQHERSVTLFVSAAFLFERFETLLDELPRDLRRYFKGKKAILYRQHLPLRAEMSLAANSLLTCELEGALLKSYAEAKALELLALTIQAVIENEQGLLRPERGLTSRDIDCINEARQILDGNYVTPPTIGDLARQVGVNEAKLMHAFKQVFGQTIFDYTQRLRMDEAKRLLETTEKSITEIAFDVGYEYSSNFTTAFKRRFFITPSVARDAFRR